MLLAIFVIALLVLVIILMTGQKSGYKVENKSGREGFGDILGALGDYQGQLSAAIDQTSQSDPSKRLQPWPAYNAGSYIQSYATAMRKAGVPPVEPVTITSKCKAQCKSDDPLASQNCSGLCYTQNNVKRYCDIQCQYSDEPLELCVKGCMETKMVNGVSSTWGFFDH